VDAVARAEGIQLGSDAVQRVFKQAGSLAPQWQSSMARDLEVGRRLEVEALSGAVVRRGRTYDIATPVQAIEEIGGWLRSKLGLPVLAAA
jgi:2-dehydropantoate 2-reductase